MSLISHYILILKVIRKINKMINYLFYLKPTRFLLSYWMNSQIDKIFSHDLKSQLTEILGDFDYFRNIERKDEFRKIIKLANQTIDHQFNVLGSGFVEIDPIDWHSDFKSHFTWSKGKFYLNYKLVDLTNDADVKVPWELSRSHHLLWLGEAFLLTGDEKYAKEVVFQISEWINDNPFMLSINWSCSMDVAIRAINWMYAVNMITNSKIIDKRFVELFDKSLFEHGFHIFNNLEKAFPYSGNHYATNIAGLLFIGQYFKESKHGKKWWDFALSEFYTDIRSQVLPNGVHFEKSTSYHRLITEVYLYSLILVFRTGEVIPGDIKYRVSKMFEYIKFYTKPNGLAPLIGDNDNGRLLSFLEYNFCDHRYLLGLAFQINDVCNYNEFKEFKEFGMIDRFFLLNALSNSKFLDIYDKTINSDVKIYTDAGFAIVNKKSLYILFKNSEISQYYTHQKIIGTHTHSDALSFELALNGNDIFIDPGSFTYTSSPKLRSEFRSTKKHNTISVDDLDQTLMVQDNMFAVQNSAIPEVIRYFRIEETESFIGEFKWQLSEREQIVHRRSISFHKNNDVGITDSLIFKDKHKFSFYFHLSPDIEIKQTGNIFYIKTDSNYEYKFNISNSFAGLKMFLADDTVSPSYGVIEESKTIIIELIADNSFELNFNIKKI